MATWHDTYDQQWAAATTAAQRAQIEAARDIEGARIAKENDDWHRAHGTGIYATSGGGGGGNSAQAAADNSAREGAAAWLKTVLSQYGMDTLAGSVDSLVQQWGTNTQVIGLKLKDTDQYKTRFKGMLALKAKGVTDINTEAEYLTTESQYRAVFRDAGLQDFLGASGSQAEIDSIAKLAADYSVSVNEVKSRVSDAQRVANDTAPEVKDALQRFYGVGPAQLVQYVLDPAKTTDQINRQVNAGLAGGYAARQNLNLDLNTAEQIANLSGVNDISTQALQNQISSAAATAKDVRRLANIDNTDLTDSEIAQNEFKLSQDSTNKIKKLQSSERARFGGTSGIQTGTLSNNSGF